MNKVLISWIGVADIQNLGSMDQGAIVSIIQHYNSFSEIVLLGSHDVEKEDMKTKQYQVSHQELKEYQAWLQKVIVNNTKIVVRLYSYSNKDPTDYGFVYEKANKHLLHFSDKEVYVIYINLTSGTPTMSATWVLLGKAIYDAILVQSSLQRGIQEVDLPYELILSKYQEKNINKLFNEDIHQNFSHIPAKSEKMRIAIELSNQLAQYNVSVLITGETGTGKEVLAKAIHSASERSDKSMLSINCGAITESLIESELFGSKKGGFTGAEDKDGMFVAANGSTLFLDEIGELSLAAQVKLLRVLQEQEVMPVGGTKAISINVRVIAATHRNLLEMVNAGSFREDLFYRLAVGIIQIPSLQQRKEDIQDLMEILINKVNKELLKNKRFKRKVVTKQAVGFIQEYDWQGNIRELENTLLRVAIWNPTISDIQVEHIKNALINRQSNIDANSELYLPTELGSVPIDIPEKIELIKKYYSKLALQTFKNKKQAAKYIGLKNSQTLDNWINS